MNYEGKMKEAVKFLAVAGVAMLSGCMNIPAPTPMPHYVSRCPEVHVGMTFDQVSVLLGQPIKKYTESATTVGTLTGYQYIGRNVVIFIDGKVQTTSCTQAPQTYDRPRS